MQGWARLRGEFALIDINEVNTCFENMLQSERLLTSTARTLASTALKARVSAQPLAGPGRPGGVASPAARMAAGRRDISGYGGKFRLTMDTINPNVKNMEYAVRGKMPQEAAKIESAIKKVGYRVTGKHCAWC